MSPEGKFPTGSGLGRYSLRQMLDDLGLKLVTQSPTVDNCTAFKESSRHHKGLVANSEYLSYRFQQWMIKTTTIQ
ncbi:hypothetical protein C464_01686 [Halorubrum coriense DSM 10284]|uniref:Uncharacterized protein n=1 Tax=Halorubrum coriense DSM 10284 TaxID=1227466 RepID=M0EUM3_9EURY|nr:hypothetical protein C464_01686 [Halorubrum coriense DSM 10284]